MLVTVESGFNLTWSIGMYVKLWILGITLLSFGVFVFVKKVLRSIHDLCHNIRYTSKTEGIWNDWERLCVFSSITSRITIFQSFAQCLTA